jgi:hypothetical protein
MRARLARASSATLLPGQSLLDNSTMTAASRRALAARMKKVLMTLPAEKALHHTETGGTWTSGALKIAIPVGKPG